MIIPLISFILTYTLFHKQQKKSITNHIFHDDKVIFVVLLAAAPPSAPAFKRGLSAKLTGGVFSPPGLVISRPSPLASAGGKASIQHGSKLNLWQQKTEDFRPPLVMLLFLRLQWLPDTSPDKFSGSLPRCRKRAASFRPPYLLQRCPWCRTPLP